MRNDRKNLYVTNSGHRYIDFAKAVGGESVGSGWYSGFLSADNVHPTVDGAKALANRLFLDFPEILNN
jgi:lysophospholipase L1-like esterase